MNLPKSFTPLSRRSFLRGAGAVLALPLLEAMMPRLSTAAAQAATRRRMICINTSLGIHTPFFFPEQGGRSYASSPYLQPFDALRESFTVCSGLSHPEVNGGHNASVSLLTAAAHPGSPGFRNTISMDQLVAERIGPQTRFPSLTLKSGGNSTISYTRAGIAIPAEQSPSKIFAKLFVDGTPAQVAAQVGRLRDGRSIMDTVGEEAKRFSRKMGSRDREKLDEYFTSVREVEKRLVQSEAWEQKPKPRVEAKAPKDITDNADLIGRSRLLYDVMHLAVQTDSTRLITLNIEGNATVPPIDGVNDGHHNLSHHGQDPTKLAQLKLIELAEMTALAEFIGKLKTTAEGSGTLLDETMVFFASNLGNASSHDNRNLPILLAGGRFKHGQHLQFNRVNNTPLCNLFLSMLQHLGMEMDSFGSSRGTLAGLAV